MPNYNSEQLSNVFRALADPTRRAVLEQLNRGAAPMSELARPYKMALPSFAQHLELLERCGLVKSQKSGRVRTYQLAPQRLKIAQSWLEAQRLQWERRLHQLDAYLHDLKQERT